MQRQEAELDRPVCQVCCPTLERPQYVVRVVLSSEILGALHYVFLESAWSSFFLSYWTTSS